MFNFLNQEEFTSKYVLSRLFKTYKLIYQVVNQAHIEYPMVVKIFDVDHVNDFLWSKLLLT